MQAVTAGDSVPLSDGLLTLLISKRIAGHDTVLSASLTNDLRPLQSSGYPVKPTAIPVS